MKPVRILEPLPDWNIGLRTVAKPPTAISSVLLLVVGLVASCANDTKTTVPSARPQSSEPPLPYESQEVRFVNADAGIELAGTLTLPSGKGVHPAVVLVTGAGPQDRDETIAGHKPFLVLAEYLARRGIAVLRYDDRGVGASTGNFAAATMHDFAGDARAAIEFLRSRKEIDRAHIGLAGHSEGGTVVTMVALAVPGEVAFLALLAAPGLPGEQIFYLQDAVEKRALGVDETAIELTQQRKQQMFAVLKAEPDLEKAAVMLKDVMHSMNLTAEEQSALAASGMHLDRMIDQQIRLLNNAATRLFLVYDPAAALARVTVPVLAITGERDLQVPPDENLPVIEKALATGRCPNYSVRKLPGLNHLFQTSTTGLPRDYPKFKETFAPTALEAITDWILSQTRDPDRRRSP